MSGYRSWAYVMPNHCEVYEDAYALGLVEYDEYGHEDEPKNACKCSRGPDLANAMEHNATIKMS